jgi:DNA polymerase-3 subunit delta
MDALVWLREYAQQSIRPVYAVFGDDPYLIHESIDCIVKLVFPPGGGDAAVSRFAGPPTPLATVLDEVCTLPFFSRRRVVIVEEADPFVTKYRAELEAYVQNPHDSGVLVLHVKRWASTTNLARLVEELGVSINCAAPSDGALAAWLPHLAKTRFDAQLDPSASRLLVELVGPEAGVLASEVEKLAVYAGESKRIERTDVTRLVGAGRVETIWKTLDAATLGQGGVALEHLESLLGSGEEPVGVLAAMSVNLLKVHHAGRLRTARLDLDEACRSAGIPVFAFDKTRRQHAHLGPSRVDQLPALLLRADLDLKGGSSLEPRAILERLLLRLALPRTD